MARIFNLFPNDISVSPESEAISAFKLVRSVTVGRNDEDDAKNEDTTLIHFTTDTMVLAAIDGITPLTPEKYPIQQQGANGAHIRVTAAFLAKLAVKECLTLLRPGMTYPAFLRMLVASWNSMRKHFGVPEDEILGAVFVAYVKFRGQPAEIWRLGDCQWGYETADGQWMDSLNGQRAENSTDAMLRAERIRSILAERRLIYPQDVQANPPLLAELVTLGWADMRCKRIEEHRTKGCYTWLTDAEEMLRHFHVHKPLLVPDGLRRLVLTTDGAISIPHRIEDAIAQQARLREQDVLVLGDNDLGVVSAKCYVHETTGEPLKYNDDMGLVEAVFNAA